MNILNIILVTADKGVSHCFESTNSNKHYRIQTISSQELVLKTVYSDTYKNNADLFIIDSALPGMGYIDLINSFNANTKVKNTPFVALGDKGTEEEELKLLSTGAKDYLKRPFNSEIASIRLKNILSFCSSINSLNPGGEVRIADLVLNFDDFTAKMKGRPIHFSKEEMTLLRLLAQRL